MLIARPSQSQLVYPTSGYDRDLAQPVCNAIEGLPPTRFYGSKRKLLPWIYSNVAHLKFETALDLFGGSASVSLLFKIMQKSVVYHDGFRFNEDVGRTSASVRKRRYLAVRGRSGEGPLSTHRRRCRFRAREPTKTAIKTHYRLPPLIRRL